MTLEKRQRRREWWLATLSSIVGTMVGIAVTFGIGIIADQQKKKNDRKLIAKIIASNIEIRMYEMEAYLKTAQQNLPYVKQILTLTPEEIEALPDDSLTKYFNVFTLRTISHNDFGRTLLHHNLDILRSYNDYYFVYYAEYFFRNLDFIESGYNSFCMANITNYINEYLTHKAAEEGVIANSNRWDLLQVVQSNDIKNRIQYYVQLSDQCLEEYLSIIEKIKSELYPIIEFSSGVSVEEMTEFKRRYYPIDN